MKQTRRGFLGRIAAAAAAPIAAGMAAAAVTAEAINLYDPTGIGAASCHQCDPASASPHVVWHPEIDQVRVQALVDKVIASEEYQHRVLALAARLAGDEEAFRKYAPTTTGDLT